MEIPKSFLKKEGMVLCFQNGKIMDLTRKTIKRLADEYWNNPSKLSAKIRAHEDFQTCSLCPYHGKKVFCSALKPLLPFLDDMEKFQSTSMVTVYYNNGNGIVSSADAPLKNALQYVTNMSLLEYCEHTKLYSKYFKGTDPLLGFQEVVYRIYLNIYWVKKGKPRAIKKTIEDLREAFTVTSQSCVKRLNLMCQSDAFINAYVRTQISTEMLTINLEAALNKYFK